MNAPTADLHVTAHPGEVAGKVKHHDLSQEYENCAGVATAWLVFYSLLLACLFFVENAQVLASLP